MIYIQAAEVLLIRKGKVVCDPWSLMMRIATKHKE